MFICILFDSKYFLFRIPDESSGDEELATLILWYIFQEMTVAF